LPASAIRQIHTVFPCSQSTNESPGTNAGQRFDCVGGYLGFPAGNFCIDPSYEIISRAPGKGGSAGVKVLPLPAAALALYRISSASAIPLLCFGGGAD
jgi:hypothetical protein